MSLPIPCEAPAGFGLHCTQVVDVKIGYEGEILDASTVCKCKAFIPHDRINEAFQNEMEDR